MILKALSRRLSDVQGKSEDKIRDKKIKESQFTQIKDREVTHKELVLMNNHNNSNGED